jgi:hypothetical protein
MFVAGDTLKFTKSLGDYLPSVGWVLTYSLVKDGDQEAITATDNGDETHLVNVAATVTAAYSAGIYRWQSYVTKAAERYSIASGTIEAVADFAAATSGLDARAHCKRTLDALEATIEGKASKDQAGYSISFGEGGASRSISRLSFGELIEARKFYKNEYQRLIRQQRVSQGLDSGRTIHIRMGV